ncbi:MAG: lysophospholipid acyltransferase family protein [Tissierellia bacterium]|nr:lysophospholipid acyltransferase family protein [Tissierellia bacterium]
MLYKLAIFLLKPFFYFFYRIQVHGAYPLPEGPMVVIANHSHALDPFFISIIFPRKIHWMAKKELYDHKIMGALLRGVETIPVNREENDLKALRAAMAYLREGKVLGIFPEGTRVKEVDLHGKKTGTAVLAHRMKATIIPLYIESDFSLFKKTHIYFRPPLKLPSGKRKEEDYKQDMVGLMARIYGIEEE